MHCSLHNISFEQFQDIVRETIPLLGSEMVSVTEASGRVLRETVTSDIAYPNATVSAADGYCLRASATAGATSTDPARLAVRATITAGMPGQSSLGEGECARLMTGAMLPPGADAVVRVEEVTETDGVILIAEPVQEGALVRRKGEIIRQGETALNEGLALTPGHLAVLAALHSGPVSVSRLPVVGVIVTGDELTDHRDVPEPGCVRSSNGVMLGGLLRSRGIKMRHGGISPDSTTALSRHLKTLAGSDVVIISGGLGVGEHDLTTDTLDGMGASIILRGVRMKPGRHMALARLGETFCFCLPGSPVGCFILFHLVVWPALLVMMGARQAFPEPVAARWGGPSIETISDRRVMLAALDSDLAAQPVVCHGSGDIRSIGAADCLVTIPGGVGRISHGQKVEVFTLGSPQ
jgi:molybdopterin molybdotransferase